MTSPKRWSLLVLVGLTFSCIAYGQPGGFGGGQGRQGGGISGSQAGPRGDATLEGTWTLEFELEFDPNNPEATGERTTIRADVTLLGVEVNARFRQPAEGEFTCTLLEGSDRCENGRLLIVWPDKNVREAADFEFVIDRIDNGRAKGEASFLNSATGPIRQYSIDMRKR